MADPDSSILGRLLSLLNFFVYGSHWAFVLAKQQEHKTADPDFLGSIQTEQVLEAIPPTSSGGVARLRWLLPQAWTLLTGRAFG